MLVLSRRENERVLFPNLGIAIEVVRIKGRTVRIGIDAPKEVRAVRGELDIYDVAPLSPNRFDPIDNVDTDQAMQLKQNLDAANLAIHLAQNQIRQGLEEQANEILTEAIVCIKNVERCLELQETPQVANGHVCETGSGYQINRRQTALVITDRSLVDRAFVATFGSLGHRCVIANPKNAISYLMNQVQPKIVLADRSSCGQVAGETGFEICFRGVSTLRRSSPLQIESHQYDAWFSCAEDQRRLLETLRSAF